MISRHFLLSSELTGDIAKRLPHAKNQLSAPGSFFNNFVKDIYIYTKRTKVFQHLILFHINNAKMGLFMKKVTSKRYGIQLIGFQIRIICIQISPRLIFRINHLFLTFCNYQSVPLYARYAPILTTMHDGNELPIVAQADKIVH